MWNYLPFSLPILNLHNPSSFALPYLPPLSRIIHLPSSFTPPPSIHLASPFGQYTHGARKTTEGGWELKTTLELHITQIQFKDQTQWNRWVQAINAVEYGSNPTVVVP